MRNGWHGHSFPPRHRYTLPVTWATNSRMRILMQCRFLCVVRVRNAKQTRPQYTGILNLLSQVLLSPMTSTQPPPFHSTLFHDRLRTGHHCKIHSVYIMRCGLHTVLSDVISFDKVKWCDSCYPLDCHFSIQYQQQLTTSEIAKWFVVILC